MDFKDFINCIPKITQEKLLGDVAHQLMSPPERIELMKEFELNKVTPREAAVMMLFYPKNNNTHLVLILRNSYNGVHSSQIAFPGGKVEKFDINYEQTALRETHEEIGVDPKSIKIIRPFTEIYVPPSNFIVYPFLGFASDELSFYPDPKEVAGIIELPINDFLDDKLIVNKIMSTSYSNNIQVPAFLIKEHLVWGATAMILSELKQMLKKVL